MNPNKGLKVRYSPIQHLQASDTEKARDRFEDRDLEQEHWQAELQLLPNPNKRTQAKGTAYIDISSRNMS